MKRIATMAAAVALLAVLPAGPALAGWKLIPASAAVKVAKGTLAVTPGEAWNKGGSRPVPKSEVWTLDGVSINELYFVSGLVAGETLYRDSRKNDQPLPKFGPAMQIAEIPEFFESSNRLALDTSVFQVTSVEPAVFGGKPGVRFAFDYAVQGSTVMRRGLASATIDGGKLYLISFVAPATYFFDRDRGKAEAIMDSARF